jgi:hypothetical protein
VNLIPCEDPGQRSLGQADGDFLGPDRWLRADWPPEVLGRSDAPGTGHMHSAAWWIHVMTPHTDLDTLHRPELITLAGRGIPAIHRS